MSNGKFKKLLNKLNELNGQHEIPFPDLFPPEFMKKYTEFNTIGEMIEASNFKVQSNKDFKNIPDEQWAKFVDDTTDFSDWDEMVDKAGEIWTTKQLDFE